MTRADVYQSVTDRIIEAIEAGTSPWRVPWIGGGPSNVANGRPYRGINIFLLTLTGMAKGYADSRWGTFKACREAAVKQARSEGRKIEIEQRLWKGRKQDFAVEIVNDERVPFRGGVRKDEKATSVILWKPIERKRKNADGEDEDAGYLLIQQFPVFNADQCDGMPAAATAFEHDPIERAEEIVRTYVPNGPLIQFGGGSAYYQPSRDLVACPKLDQFERVEAYYSTLYHELVHSTGHKSRLDRLERTGFGSGPYAKEELVAEMGAAMLCGMAGIENLDQSAAYVKNWLGVLKDDATFAVNAAANAQKAADLILGTAFDSQETENPVEAVAA